MFILSFISSSLEFSSVSHTSIYKNIKFFGEISNDLLLNDLLATNVHKTLKSC